MQNWRQNAPRANLRTPHILYARALRNGERRRGGCGSSELSGAGSRDQVGVHAVVQCALRR